jgi:hypothetical protein
MTRVRAFGRDIAFLEWLRTNELLDSTQERTSITDCDVWIHRYADWRNPNSTMKIDNIMVLETKSHQYGPAVLRISASDTYAVMNALFMSGVRRKNGSIKTRRVLVQSNGKSVVRYVRWWGVHILSMSGDRPENSMMWWNERPQPITTDTLIALIQFKLAPDTLLPIDYRDHHENEKAVRPLLRSML